MPPPDAPASHLARTLRDLVEAAVRQVDASAGFVALRPPDGAGTDRSTGKAGAAEGHPPPEDGQPALHVPVRVGGSVFGTLVLTRGDSGRPFSSADAAVARGLAAVAGTAIENARLADRADTRRRWDLAATETATELFSGARPDDVLRSVSVRVAALTTAALTVALSPSRDDRETLTVVAAAGSADDDLEGVRVPLTGTNLGAAVQGGRPRRLADIGALPVTAAGATAVVVEFTAGHGPALVVPLSSGPDRSVLVSLRAVGSPGFCPAELDLLLGFAAQVGDMMAAARAARRARRSQMQADRDRIARDLHDHVVQRIFATALSLDRLGRSLEDDRRDVSAALSQRVDDLHGTIERIRTSIFDLHENQDPSTTGLRRRLAEVLRSITDGHEVRPDLRLRSERDDVPPDLVLDLIAVVRELVTNVVRHAQARRVTVAVELRTTARVVVTDDGRGLPPVTVRSGLANLADRAERRGGELSCTSSPSGTEICWTVPLPE